MTRLKSILCATLLTLAVSSSAFAGDISGRKGDISGMTISGDISGRSGATATRPGDISGVYGALLDVLSMVV